MDPELRELFQELARELIEQNPEASISDLNRRLGVRMAGYNDAGQPEMCGLSPRQTHRLLYETWDGPSPALVLNRTPPASELGGSRMLANARLLLAALRDQGGVKATAAGNLNRAFVIEISKAIFLDGEWVEIIQQQGKSLKEAEIPDLNVVRWVLQLAGLLRKTKGVFYATRKGSALIEEARAGELLAILFETVFRRLNLWVFTSYGPEFPSFQHSIAFSLYAFGKLAGDWLVEDDVYERLTLPIVRDHVAPRETHDPLKWLVSGCFIQPLEKLGLAEIEESEWVAGKLNPPSRVRKTPLFDRLITFSLD